MEPTPTPSKRRLPLVPSFNDFNSMPDADDSFPPALRAPKMASSSVPVAAGGGVAMNSPTARGAKNAPASPPLGRSWSVESAETPRQLSGSFSETFTRSLYELMRGN